MTSTNDDGVEGDGDGDSDDGEGTRQRPRLRDIIDSCFAQSETNE